MRVSSLPLVRIIDDDESLRKSEAFIIKIIGLECASFESGEAFLEKGDRVRPGCIICDLRMDGMTGLQLQDKLNELGCDLPFVFLTGHGSLDSAVYAFKSGARDFLQKPVKPQVLQELVLKLVRESRERWEQKRRTKKCRELFASLTDREKDVLRLAATGIANKEISEELGIALQTVKIHRGNAFHKLNLKNAVDAHRFLLEIGEI